MNKNKYRKGKIYIIRSDQTDEIYIGSTVMKLEKRLRKHESNFREFNNGTYNYVTSFELLKHNNYKIELLEAYPCVSKKKLRRREGHYIKTIECVNKVIPGRTKAEYRIDNKAQTDQYNADYYQKHKDHIKSKHREIIICECGSIHTHVGTARHKRTIKHNQYIQSSN